MSERTDQEFLSDLREARCEVLDHLQSEGLGPITRRKREIFRTTLLYLTTPMSAWANPIPLTTGGLSLILLPILFVIEGLVIAALARDAAVRRSRFVLAWTGVTALTFVFPFAIGGLTGLMQGALNLNTHLHDTYFIVGHFHYVMFGGTGMGFFAALLYWFPKMFGRMYRRTPAVVSWVLVTVGFNVLYLPMFFLGYMGMPRRYYDYLPQFQIYHEISTVGSRILALGIFQRILSILTLGSVSA